MEEGNLPDAFMFKSLFAFINWGPFVTVDEILEALLTSNNKKSSKIANATMKKNDRSEKDANRARASSAVRGSTTDQRIDIEQLGVLKMSCTDRRNEAAIFNLSIEEGVLASQVELAENRADTRCPVYDKGDMF